MYPADANLITSLLDIHVSPPGANDEPQVLEILEAGTGHGALTLHLARAIHAANPLTYETEPGTRTHPHLLGPSNSQSLKMTHRRAIVHTVDIQSRYSAHAKCIVKGFRQGIYYKNVDFHVDDVSKWIDQQVLARGQVLQDDRAFLSYIVLDMPNAHLHLAKAASALITNGSLLVFNPSISQIMTVVGMIKQQHLPLILDTVLELGHHMTGGREWDVRSVVPREQLKSTGGSNSMSTPFKAKESSGSGVEARDQKQRYGSIENNIHESQDTMQESQMVCRPKVGGRVIGGGFLGVFKKMQNKP